MPMIAHDAELMDLTKVATTFPQFGGPTIRRENMIVTLAEMLSSDTEVIIVEGPDGIGKTTLLAQFAQAHPHHAFTLFIRSSSRWAYDSSMLIRDLCDQIGWALKKEAYREYRELDPAQMLHKRIYELQRKANYESAPYYFIVDGLNEIPDEDCQERDMVLNLLPFGLPRFRFILSGPLECLKDRAQKIRGVNPFRLAGFTFEETREFFGGLVEDKSALEVIHKVSKMVPGNLASVRRLLRSGANIDRLLEELPERLPDLFEMEWQAVKDKDMLLHHALAILAFDRRRHSVASLARLCEAEPALLEEKLVCCNFIEKRSETQEVEFVCEVFKRYVANRLSNLRRYVFDTAITDLLKSPDSTDALTHLPGFLHQAGRYDDLLTYLSPTHIGNLIDCGDSWIPLHHKADLGVDTALRLERDGDLLRFSLQRATITSMESSEPWRSEIEAYISLDDFSAAYALAQRMATKEDRLHLLAVIARSKKSKSLPVEAELNDQIQQLYRSLDRRSLGDRGVEIATDLLSTHPELAVELVQECTGMEGHKDRLDLALAKLSFRALMEKGDKMDDIESAQRTLRAKVKNPIVHEFMNRISFFFGGFSSEAVIAEVEKWEKASDRIFALRAWAVTNAKKEDAIIVLEYALNTILKTTTYTATAKVYQELAIPLIYTPNHLKAKSLISWLDGLKGPIQSAGPTVEYVKLQATLAEAEARYDRQAAFNRLQDLYYYVDALTAPSTKLASLAVLSSVLKVVDREKKFDAQGPIHALVLEDLKSTVDAILIKTAEHYEAIRPAIGALARNDTKIALEVIDKLNTAPRREAALVELLQEIAGEAPSENNFIDMNKAFEKLGSIYMQAKAIHVTLRGLLSRKNELAPYLPRIIALREWTKNIPDAEEKCQALCILIELLIIHKSLVSPSLIDSMTEELVESWETIDSGWSRVDSGFIIVKVLADCSPSVSRAFLNKIEKARSEIILDCPDTARSYIRCVQLAVRSFSGLIKRKLYSKEDLDTLEELINKIPSISTRMIAWSELALKFLIAHDLTQCQEIAKRRIRPILESEVIGDAAARWEAIGIVAPALYCAHEGSARQLLEKLPQPYRDEAYSKVCSFLITKHLPTEAYDPASKSGERVNYEDFLDIYKVLGSLNADHIIYWHLESLVDGLHKRFRDRFNKQQIADILQKLKQLAGSIFPNPAYIKHEGYKILSEAQIARLERDTSVWDGLAKRARALPNVADSAFVLMGVGAAMPNKELLKAQTLLREAKDQIPNIATFEDRCGRYEHLAKLSADVDKQLSKECLRQAWRETIPLDPGELPTARRRIIDFAHRLDPDFAATLASELDEDPGRDLARKQAEKRIEVLKLRDLVAAGESRALASTQDSKQGVEVAKALLTGLNSNRINPVHIVFTRQSVGQASQMNLEDAFVVFSWVIENAVRRYSDTDQATTYLRPMYEAVRLSSELAFKIAARIRSVTDSGISVARRSGPDDTSLIHPGEREKALTHFRDWVSKATRFIKITDPYFGPEQLELVQLIRSVNPTIPISILTGRNHHQGSGVKQPWDDTYQSYWRLRISDSNPGAVKIVIVGKGPTGEHPIHDRWWLSESGGLRVGTSASSLGVRKLSEISEITVTEANTRIEEVDRYLEGSVREVENERLKYLSFYL